MDAVGPIAFQNLFAEVLHHFPGHLFEKFVLHFFFFFFLPVGFRSNGQQRLQLLAEYRRFFKVRAGSRSAGMGFCDRECARATPVRVGSRNGRRYRSRRPAVGSSSVDEQRTRTRTDRGRKTSKSVPRLGCACAGSDGTLYQRRLDENLIRGKRPRVKCIHGSNRYKTRTLFPYIDWGDF